MGTGGHRTTSRNVKNEDHMNKKTVITIIVTSVSVLLIALGSAYVLKYGLKAGSPAAATPSKESLEQSASTAETAGTAALNDGDTKTAVTQLTAARDAYKKAGDEKSARRVEARLSLAEHGTPQPAAPQKTGGASGGSS